MKKTLGSVVLIFLFAGILFYGYDKWRADAYSPGQPVWILQDSTEGVVLMDASPIGRIQVHYKDNTGVYHTEGFTKAELAKRNLQD